MQTKNERGYDYISFAIGNAVIKLNETQENSATVRVVSMYNIIQYNFIFNTETGNLFIEHKGRKGTKWYPATVKTLAGILRLLNALKKYAIVSEYYKQFIGAVMQWHR